MIRQQIRRVYRFPLIAFSLLVGLLKTVRLTWLYVRFLLRFGPDIATQIARGTRPEDLDNIDRIALQNWSNEGHYLLPRRYKLILDQLLAERLISIEAHGTYTERTTLTITDPNLIKEVDIDEMGIMVKDASARFPWVDNPEILTQVSDRLRSKIKTFAEDQRVYASFLEAAILTQTLYPPD